MRRLSRKSVLLTGAASGIGACSARLLRQEGAAVTVSDVNVKKGRAVADAIGAHFVELDVTSEEAWILAMKETIKTHGALHVLVNGAGIGSLKSVEDCSLEEWRRVHAIDLDGTFLGCKYGVKEIKKHTKTLGGSIINISSVSGIVGAANLAAYNSAKAGVRLLSKSVALHCAKERYNIRCNSVHPSFIDTPILDDIFNDTPHLKDKLARQIPLGRLGTPDDVAWPIVFLASDESRFITGSELVIDGGISAM